MALPLSGSVKEDVELVKIETIDFSLVIKGKPYHERYEGLQQYRNLDFHNIMRFIVNGEGIEEIKVFDLGQQGLIELHQHRPIFFENGIYQVMVQPKREKELTFYHENPKLRKAIDRVQLGSSYVLLGNLSFQNEVGYSSFEIREGKHTLLEVTLEIFPTKLSYKDDYNKLLDEVNNEIYNLAFHFLKKTYLNAKTRLEGNPSPAEFFRLITFYFNSFLKAIEQIEKQPQHKLEKTYEIVRGDRLKSIDSAGRNYLRKNSHLFQKVKNGVKIGDKNFLPIKGLTHKKEITNDTHENRFVKWMIYKLSLKINDLLEKYANKGRWSDIDQDDELHTMINEMKTRLDKKLKTPFWKGLRLPDRPISSLVLQLAPGYRDAYQIFLTVSKGLTLQNSIHKMSVKDVATLYEYWTFLKLGQLLGKKYLLVSQDIIKVNRDGLFVNLEANKQATRIYKHPITNEKIILTYQKYEGNLPTISQKPDTMLSIEKRGENYSFNYVFDAKYRIDFAAGGTYYGNKYKSPGPLEEDINTMHRYRDSIVAEHQGPYERTAFGAYVLFPWNEENLYEKHHFYESIGKVNIGALPFLPNATSLVERFIENLIDKSPEEIQKEGILPRGSLQKWKESIEEKVLIGVVSTAQQHESTIKGLGYRIPLSLLRSGWQEAKYVALYMTKEVGKENGVVCYGRISNIEIGQDYVKFSVSSWTPLKKVIKPVGYGIATYIVTTLQELKNAKELPELFMKTDEEKIVWKMLRRVSDQIKVDLDNENIDKAHHIRNFKIRGITISFNMSKDSITIYSKHNNVTFVHKEMTRNPSIIYKVIIRELAKESGD
jgi:uncharacterized protein